MSENPFIEKMEQHSNEKLIYILTTDKDGFQDEALKAAKIVLDGRDISGAEKLKIQEKIQERERIQKEAEDNKPKSLLKGPGIIVTILVLVPPMVLIKDRGMGITFLIALIGFGAGHVVNHFYFKKKK